MPGGRFVVIFVADSDKMGDQTTLAILLGRTLLANDDAILEFFTAKWGRVSVFSKKFAKSKKRAEIDFFRLMEIQIFQGRNSKSLKNARTTTLFTPFEASLESNEIGWKWIDRLRKTTPEERPDDAFFSEAIAWFARFDTTHMEWADVAFRMRILQNTGDCPRFDIIRNDCWFDVASKQFSSLEKPTWIFLQNETRQICEFLRRSDSSLFQEKINKIPKNSLFVVQKVVMRLEEFLL